MSKNNTRGSFPALDDRLNRQTEINALLKKVWAEAGPNHDLTKVSCLAGDESQKLATVRSLTDELERLADEIPKHQLLKAQLDRLGPESWLSGDGSNWSGVPADYSNLERLNAEHSFQVWAQAKTGEQLEQGVTASQAWSEWFKGFSSGQWDGFRGMIRNQMATSPDADGGVLVPAPLSGDVIDRLRSTAPIFTAGATVVPMTAKTLTIARISGDVDATVWHAENAAITATKPTLEKLTFTAKTLPVLVKVSRELIEDAPNVGEVVAQSIAGATAVELTRAALRGNGTSNAPTGIANTSGINTTTAIGVAGIDTIIDAVRDIRIDNAEPNAAIFAPRTRGAFAKLKSTNGEYLEGHGPADYENLLKFSTTVIPTNLGVGTNETELYVGNFAKLLIGIRSQLRIEPLRERFADNGQIAFLSWLRVDVQLEHPAGFWLGSGVTN